jgi:hypothetical protein
MVGHRFHSWDSGAFDMKGTHEQVSKPFSFIQQAIGESVLLPPSIGMFSGDPFSVHCNNPHERDAIGGRGT